MPMPLPQEGPPQEDTRKSRKAELDRFVQNEVAGDRRFSTQTQGVPFKPPGVQQAQDDRDWAWYANHQNLQDIEREAFLDPKGAGQRAMKAWTSLPDDMRQATVGQAEALRNHLNQIGHMKSYLDYAGDEDNPAWAGFISEGLNLFGVGEKLGLGEAAQKALSMTTRVPISEIQLDGSVREGTTQEKTVSDALMDTQYFVAQLRKMGLADHIDKRALDALESRTMGAAFGGARVIPEIIFTKKMFSGLARAIPKPKGLAQIAEGGAKMLPKGEAARKGLQFAAGEIGPAWLRSAALGGSYSGVTGTLGGLVNYEEEIGQALDGAYVEPGETLGSTRDAGGFLPRLLHGLWGGVKAVPEGAASFLIWHWAAGGVRKIGGKLVKPPKGYTEAMRKTFGGAAKGARSQLQDWAQKQGWGQATTKWFAEGIQHGSEWMAGTTGLKLFHHLLGADVPSGLDELKEKPWAAFLVGAAYSMVSRGASLIPKPGKVDYTGEIPEDMSSAEKMQLIIDSMPKELQWTARALMRGAPEKGLEPATPEQLAEAWNMIQKGSEAGFHAMETWVAGSKEVARHMQELQKLHARGPEGEGQFTVPPEPSLRPPAAPGRTARAQERAREGFKERSPVPYTKDQERAEQEAKFRGEEKPPPGEAERTFRESEQYRFWARMKQARGEGLDWMADARDARELRDKWQDIYEEAQIAAETGDTKFKDTAENLIRLATKKGPISTSEMEQLGKWASDIDLWMGERGWGERRGKLFAKQVVGDLRADLEELKKQIEEGRKQGRVDPALLEQHRALLEQTEAAERGEIPKDYKPREKKVETPPEGEAPRKPRSAQPQGTPRSAQRAPQMLPRGRPPALRGTEGGPRGFLPPGGGGPEGPLYTGGPGIHKRPPSWTQHPTTPRRPGEAEIEARRRAGQLEERVERGEVQRAAPAQEAPGAPRRDPKTGRFLPRSKMATQPRPSEAKTFVPPAAQKPPEAPKKPQLFPGEVKGRPPPKLVRTLERHVKSPQDREKILRKLSEEGEGLMWPGQKALLSRIQDWKERKQKAQKRPSVTPAERKGLGLPPVKKESIFDRAPLPRKGKHLVQKGVPKPPEKKTVVPTKTAKRLAKAPEPETNVVDRSDFIDWYERAFGEQAPEWARAPSKKAILRSALDEFMQKERNMTLAEAEAIWGPLKAAAKPAGAPKRSKAKKSAGGLDARDLVNVKVSDFINEGKLEQAQEYIEAHGQGKQLQFWLSRIEGLRKGKKKSPRRVLTGDEVEELYGYPHEGPPDPPPDLRMKPERQARVLKRQAADELAENPIVGERENLEVEQSAKTHSIFEKARAEIRARESAPKEGEPIDRRVLDRLQYRIITKGAMKGMVSTKGRGWGFNNNFSARAAKSNQKRMTASYEEFMEKVLHWDPDFMTDLFYAATAAPMIPDMHMFRHVKKPFAKRAHQMLIEEPGLFAELLVDMSPRALGKLAEKSGLTDRAAVIEWLSNQAAVQREAWYKQIRSEKPGNVQMEGTFGTAFHQTWHYFNQSWVPYARAAQRRGYNLLREMLYHSHAPRQIFINEAYQTNLSKFQETPEKSHALIRNLTGQKHVSDVPVEWRHVMSEEGFEKLWRAHEVMEGILAPEHRQAQVEMQTYLHGGRFRVEGMEKYLPYAEMTKAEAKEAIDAFNRWAKHGDRNAATKAGLRPSTIAVVEAAGEGPGDVMKPKAAPQKVGATEEWGIDPESTAFRSLIAKMDARVPELEGAFTERREYDVDFRREGDKLVQDISVRASAEDIVDALLELRDVEPNFLNMVEVARAKDFSRAQLYLAGLVEQAKRTAGEALGTEWLERIANGESRGTGSDLSSAAIHAIRSYLKEFIPLAKEKGWLVEHESVLIPSEKIEALALMVRKARGHKENPTRNEAPYAGDINDITKICSDCTLYGKIPTDVFDEYAGKFKDAGKKTWSTMRTWAQNMRRIMQFNRPLELPSFVAHYAEQYADPKFPAFRDTILHRAIGSLRNRFGDPIANLLGQHQAERTDAQDVWYPLLLDLKKKAGWKLPNNYAIESDPMQWSRAEIREMAQRATVAHALEGKGGVTIDTLPEDMKPLVPEIRKILHMAKKMLSEHLFRALRNDAEMALKEGRDVAGNYLRRWRDVFGDVRDPKKVLDMIDAITGLEAGVTKDVHGVTVRGWGLRDYYPHLWTQSALEGEGLSHIPDPGQAPDADRVVKVPEHGNIEAEQWKVQFAKNYAAQHGLIFASKHMKNLLERLKNKDGYMEDVLWVLNQYVGRMIDKVYYERFTDDAGHLIWGEWRPLGERSDVERAEGFGEMEAFLRDLETVPTESTFDQKALVGGIDEHFSLKIGQSYFEGVDPETKKPIRRGGNVYRSGYRFKRGGRWDSPEKGHPLFTKEGKRAAAARWRAARWRWVKSFSDFTGDPAEWRLAVSNGEEMLIFKGQDAIRRAGIQVRTGGLAKYTEGSQYQALKKQIALAVGYDLDTGEFIEGKGKTVLGRKIGQVARGVHEFFYQTQLGGVANPKAFSVQMFEGMVQNGSAIGWYNTVRTLPDFRGYFAFKRMVLSAKNQAEAYERAKKKYAHTPYVQKVIPVLEEGRMRVHHLLRTHNRGGEELSKKEMTSDLLRRASFLSFTMADVWAKEHVYYSVATQMGDVKEYLSKSTGKRFKLTNEYVPLGKQYTGSRDTISGHDIARMVMERTHFTLQRYAQPALMRTVGWQTVGHLGTQASNISFEFMYGLRKMAEYAKKGEPQNLWMAQKSARYAIGLYIAYALAQALGRDIGEYVGAHVSDVGMGDLTMGKFAPGLKALPAWVRMPAFQIPTKGSLPWNFWFGEPGKGVPRTMANALLRTASGEQSLPEAFGGAFSRFWNNNSRTIGLGPWSRSGRHFVGMFTAQKSDLDPDRPYMVRDPAWMGWQRKTRYRSAFELYFADLFLPGWSYHDSEQSHRADWVRELNSTRAEVGQDLRRQLQSENPQKVKEAYRRLRERGYRVDAWRVRKRALLEGLPSYARWAISSGDRLTKLRTFATLAPGWSRNVRRRALQFILPTQGKIVDLPQEVIADVRQALSAPEP